MWSIRVCTTHQAIAPPAPEWKQTRLYVQLFNVCSAATSIPYCDCIAFLILINEIVHYGVIVIKWSHQESRRHHTPPIETCSCHRTINRRDKYEFAVGIVFIWHQHHFGSSYRVGWGVGWFPMSRLWYGPALRSTTRRSARANDADWWTRYEWFAKESVNLDIKIFYTFII